jgi:hypothetical protein
VVLTTAENVFHILVGVDKPLLQGEQRSASLRSESVFLDPTARIVHHFPVARRSLSLAAALLTLMSASGVAWSDDGAAAAAAGDVAADPVDLTEGEAEEPEPDKPDEPDWMTAEHERRASFTLGIMGSAMLGESEGFPNDALKIDRLDHYTQTGAAGGGQLSIYAGVAASDWLVFGLGGQYARMVTGELDNKSYGGYFHVDLFPGWPLGGEWREFGLYLDAGVAFTNTTTFDDPDFELVESGGASRVAVGAFYEGVRLWKLSMGPFVGYDQIWSQSAFRPSGMLGWRTALYAGP